jgi:membrane protein implicated in regulation of membrane protease activity
MLTPRQAQFAFVPLMVTVMSAVISLTMTAVHHGLVAGLLDAWLHNWALAFAVALPVAWVTVPSVRAMLARLTRTEPTPARRLGEMG